MKVQAKWKAAFSLKEGKSQQSLFKYTEVSGGRDENELLANNLKHEVTRARLAVKIDHDDFLPLT